LLRGVEHEGKLGKPRRSDVPEDRHCLCSAGLQTEFSKGLQQRLIGATSRFFEAMTATDPPVRSARDAGNKGMHETRLADAFFSLDERDVSRAAEHAFLDRSEHCEGRLATHQ
jgi:hypothetical protein